MFEALQPDSPYVFYSDDHGFCINTADVMDILTMDKESVIYRQEAIDTLTRLEPSFRGSVLEQALKNMPDVSNMNGGEKFPELRAEPEPSYWIPVNNNEVACHKCKSVFVYWLGMYSFCHSCGAYMREGR